MTTSYQLKRVDFIFKNENDWEEDSSHYIKSLSKEGNTASSEMKSDNEEEKGVFSTIATFFGFKKEAEKKVYFPSFSSSTLIPYLRIFCWRFWRNIWALREASEMFQLLSFRIWVI